MLLYVLFFMFSYNLLIFCLFLLIFLNLIRRPCFGKGKIQGYWRRFGYRLRRTYPQGINSTTHQLKAFYTTLNSWQMLNCYAILTTLAIY